MVALIVVTVIIFYVLCNLKANKTYIELSLVFVGRGSVVQQDSDCKEATSTIQNHTDPKRPALEGVRVL